MTTDNNSTIASAGRPERPIVALAWPTGRPIYPYTADEIAAGVDLYTRRLKAEAAEAGDPDAR
ncbi:hypothetical protein Rhe02_37510 [Rhizocola hellebori]|uniref:Uncharacterized protein n=1 Tax=Rhizocola hellebori TaxID=1392758 RepID=A0A8J3Q7X8_9ACTN|nr:hypothetical protein [Rhizocola hellebori]GIH05684.1 hypothetical protein Rhe02_37510 [Rhizocola hellebori]